MPNINEDIIIIENSKYFNFYKIYRFHSDERLKKEIFFYFFFKIFIDESNFLMSNNSYTFAKYLSKIQVFPVTLSQFKFTFFCINKIVTKIYKNMQN